MLPEEDFRAGAARWEPRRLEKSELAKVLGRGVGDKAHGAYSLSMQQAEGMAHLRDEIESLVEQFNASPQTKNSVKQSSERNAVKLLPELGPTKAAIASVAQEFLNLGRSMAEVSFYISRVHPRVGRLSSLVLEVYAPDEGRAVERPGQLPEEGLQVLLGRARTGGSGSPVYCWDGGAVVDLQNAVLCEGRYPAKRMRLLGPSKFVLVLPERTFQLFKILEEAKLSGAIPSGELVRRPRQRGQEVLGREAPLHREVPPRDRLPQQGEREVQRDPAAEAHEREGEDAQEARRGGPDRGVPQGGSHPA